jgi:hypothetical protein
MPLSPSPDVPILLETLGRPFFPMIRCNYLSVECNDPRPGWQLGVGGETTPFLMLGLVGIVHQPFGAARFTTSHLIQELFRRIEEEADLLINFDDLWLPDFLFGPRRTPGHVYRVENKLFTLAYLFREGRQKRDNFQEQCAELRQSVILSDEETAAFADWSKEQVSIAKERAPKNPQLRLRSKPSQDNLA